MHTRDIAIAPDEEVKNREEHFDYSEPFVQAREFEQSRKQEMYALAIGGGTTVLRKSLQMQRIHGNQRCSFNRTSFRKRHSKALQLVSNQERLKQ